MSTSCDTYTDGGARGNPGPAGIGVVLRDRVTKEVHEFSKYLGKTTNNQAEYQALLYAVRKAFELGYVDVACYLDSELVVKQMKREYRVKDPGLSKHFIEIVKISQKFKKISFHHIARKYNSHADRLVNDAIDKGFLPHADLDN